MFKWNNTVREVFGITYCILGFKHLLQSSHFYCRTDHKNFLQMRASDNPIVNHCLDKLIPYFVTFIFNNGSKHCIPDFGSRTIALLSAFKSFNCPAAETLIACYPTAAEILTASSDTRLPQDPPGFQVSSQSDPTNFQVSGDTDSSSHSGHDLSVIPTPPAVINTLPPPIIRQSPNFPLISPDRLKVIKHYHNFAHQGITRTLQAMKQAGHYWPSMRSDVVKFIQSCPLCQLTWRIPHATYVQRDTFESYDPFYCISLDFMGPYEADIHGNKYYCAIIDVFSRYLELFAVPDATAESAAMCLLDIWAQYTLPRIISQVVATDNAQAFIGKTFSLLISYFNGTPSYTLPYSHQTSVERNNEEVLRYTRTLLLVRRDPRDQSKHVLAKLVKKIVNSSVHNDLNCAPHSIIHGIHSPLEPPLLHNEKFALPRLAKDITADIVRTQVSLLQSAQQYQAANTDKYLLPNADNPQIVYQIGQLVTVRYPNQPPTKTRPPVMGPFRIISRTGDRYIVMDLLTLKEHEYHYRRLRIFHFSEYHNTTPRDIALTNSLEFDVEDIIDHRGDIRRRSSLEFKVRFTGYDDSYDDWISTNQVCRHPRMPHYLERHPHLRSTVMRFQDAQE